MHSRKDSESGAYTRVSSGDQNILALQFADTLVLSSISENVENGLGIAFHVVLNTRFDILHGLYHFRLGKKIYPVSIRIESFRSPFHAHLEARSELLGNG